ncbi:CoA activase [bacterium]|nr:CoA activase [bacterium]
MNKETMLYVGIDVGSTTVKAVVLDNENTVLWKEYKRHNTRQPELVKEMLEKIALAFPDDSLSLFITGSGSRSLAESVNALYVQEVNAVGYAVEILYPDVASVVELGGQDAKVIIFKGEGDKKSTLTFMNDKCAGGTGATIDKILDKIGLHPLEAAKIRKTDQTMHHVAAKCGVFAETDVVGLLKAGVDKEDIFVSLCAAIVRQNLEVLVRGNVLKGRVILLGGPHTYLPALTDVWREILPETWAIHKWTPRCADIKESIFVPDDAQFFAATGAVLFGRKKSEISHISEADKPRFEGVEKLDNYICSGRIKQLEASGSVLDGLVKDAAEVQRFAEQYAVPEFVSPHFEKGRIYHCFLGIDGGSTSTKLAILDEKQNLIYRDYTLSNGNPIEDVRTMFGRIDAWQKEEGITLDIVASGVTGYAASILQKAFKIENAIVETVAHMKSAVAEYGDVDLICDVGGQDIKVLFMNNGRVVDFKLNTQCSAGNGFFLQSMASQFNIPVEQYAEHAFKAKKAPAFNYGCAVFMEQDKVNFQQLGWTKDEIMAGLALVLPKNIWNYVVQEPHIAKFGRRFVLQGGTQKNLAAAKAQVDYIKEKVPDADVFVHKYADICGAVGAAIESIEQQNGSPSFIGVERGKDVEFTTQNDETTRCKFCSNRCARTFVDIRLGEDEQVRFISGYKCEKGMAESVDDMKKRADERSEKLHTTPNLVEESATLVFDDFIFKQLPQNGANVSQSDYYPTNELKEYNQTQFHSLSAEKRKIRSEMVVGLPRVLNMYLYSPFFSTYFRTLGIDVVYSDYTSQELWDKGNKWGAIDPCFPAKVAPAHVYNLLKKERVTHICFPIITHLHSSVKNTLGNNACVIQMGTPEVVKAVFTRENNLFKENDVEYLRPLVSMDNPVEMDAGLFEYFSRKFALTHDENAWAVRQGINAMNSYYETLEKSGAELLNKLVDRDKMGILLIGHPYHHDPGLNHGILEQFQLRGFPVLSIESLPGADSFIDPLFTKESGDNFDIGDVWMRNFNRNTNLKVMAAKIAARHPNLAVIDLSSFKCGHDAPTYSYIAHILDDSKTPHFLFHDIDQNRPGATFNIRIETIEYFLRAEERKLKGAH